MKLGKQVPIASHWLDRSGAAAPVALALLLWRRRREASSWSPRSASGRGREEGHTVAKRLLRISIRWHGQRVSVSAVLRHHDGNEVSIATASRQERNGRPAHVSPVAFPRAGRALIFRALTSSLLSSPTPFEPPSSRYLISQTNCPSTFPWLSGSVEKRLS